MDAGSGFENHDDSPNGSIAGNMDPPTQFEAYLTGTVAAQPQLIVVGLRLLAGVVEADSQAVLGGDRSLEQIARQFIAQRAAIIANAQR